MTDHSSHTHPNTKSARAICRRQLAQNKPLTLSEVILSTNLDSIPLKDIKKGMTVHFDKLIGSEWPAKHIEHGYCWECKTHFCNKKRVYIHEHVEGEITEIIAWMDNSTEVVVTDSNGKKHRKMVEYPHGDICY